MIAKLGLSIKELIVKNQFILYLLIFFIAFLAYLWIQATPSFLDPDSFYHLKMTELIAAKGPILDFPWLQFTVLKDYYIDHHFLYHVCAIPFIKILGNFVGFKFYTVILATLFIFIAYVFLKKEKIKYAEVFALALLFAPDFMFRISLAKATAFSLILLFWGIYFIFKQKYWLLAAISALYVWSYGGFLLIFVMTVIYALARAIYETFISPPLWLKLKPFKSFAKLKNYLVLFLKNCLRRENLKINLASILGIGLGLVLNPYFPKNLKFYWQQLVQIGLINYRGLVNVGGEWYPYEIAKLIPDTGVAIILGVLCFVLFSILIKKQSAKSVFFFLTTCLFLFLTLKSKRYVEYFVPFLVFFSAYTMNEVLKNIDVKQWLQKLKSDNYILGTLSKFILIFMFVIFPLIMVKDAYITRKSFKAGIEFSRFAGISNYLKANAQPGQIIMQTDWDDFPMLFYHNSQNYYIVGLDPTFMYNYNAKLYNLFADITMTKKTDNLYQTIKDNFLASYFIVDNDRPGLAKILQKDGNFSQAYKDQDGEVFKLK